MSSEFDTDDGCVRIPVEKKVEKEIVITIKNENTDGGVDILMCRCLLKMRVFKMDGFARLQLPPGKSA
ncbi:MAG: hypothetical protein V2I33_23265 [Kangiellaceae bacterium]|nr:hypothetical protein [Kangiellaceae bacterium]